MRKSCHIYENPATDARELQTAEEEEYVVQHMKHMHLASEILNSSL
jgi:hypothetical protein